MSVKLKGIKKLYDTIHKLKEVADETRANLDEKQEWLDNKSDKFQEGATGQKWTEHLDTISSMLDEIDNMDPETLIPPQDEED